MPATFSFHCAVPATASRQTEQKSLLTRKQFSMAPDIATPPSSQRLPAALGSLDRFVIEALRAVKRQGGERAFNHTARDLVISVCAILAYERGTNAAVDLFDLIERVLSEAVE
jgi:hypothetical protein